MTSIPNDDVFFSLDQSDPINEPLEDDGDDDETFGVSVSDMNSDWEQQMNSTFIEREKENFV